MQMKKNVMIKTVATSFIFMALVVAWLWHRESIAWSCGSENGSVTATLKSNGTLFISGNGKMEDYQSHKDAPWHNYCDKITRVVIGKDVVYIGVNAFSGLVRLRSVTFKGINTNISEYDLDNRSLFGIYKIEGVGAYCRNSSLIWSKRGGNTIIKLDPPVSSSAGEMVIMDGDGAMPLTPALITITRDMIYFDNQFVEFTENVRNILKDHQPIMKLYKEINSRRVTEEDITILRFVDLLRFGGVTVLADRDTEYGILLKVLDTYFPYHRTTGYNVNYIDIDFAVTVAGTMRPAVINNMKLPELQKDGRRVYYRERTVRPKEKKDRNNTTNCDCKSWSFRQCWDIYHYFEQADVRYYTEISEYSYLDRRAESKSNCGNDSTSRRCDRGEWFVNDEKMLRGALIVYDSIIRIAARGDRKSDIRYKNTANNEDFASNLHVLDTNGNVIKYMYLKTGEMLINANGYPVKSVSVGDTLFTLTNPHRQIVVSNKNKFESKPLLVIDELRHRLTFIRNDHCEYAVDANEIIIVAEDHIKYETIIMAMDAARAAGMSVISFAKL